MKSQVLTSNPTIPAERIERRIFLIRGEKVMLSPDLAELYEVAPRVLVQAVKRNRDRFPEDFMFQLTKDEYADLKSQFVTSSWGGARRATPYAFTEQSVAMLASVLRSQRAVILSPSPPVILSEAKNLRIRLSVNSAKNPRIRGRAAMKTYSVYILSGKSRTLYTGVTNNLERRVLEHKRKLIPGFTAKYNLDRLVYFENGHDIRAAIAREKQIKGWLRAKKIALIIANNPTWKDLSDGWYGEDSSRRSP